MGFTGFIAAGLVTLYFPSMVLLYVSIGLTAGSGLGLLGFIPMDVITHLSIRLVCRASLASFKSLFKNITTICENLLLVNLRRLGLVVGIVSSGTGVGQLVLAPLMEAVIQWFGLAKMLMMLGGLQVALLTTAGLFRRSIQTGAFVTSRKDFTAQKYD